MKKYINLPDLVQELKKRGLTITETADTSLTVPMDQVNNEERAKDQAKKARRVHMSHEELDAALEGLVREWPQVEKRWADPPIIGQKYCSFSFVPSSGSSPDKDGLYGYLKVRGTFEREEDRDAHAEEILNNVDSYHAIHHGRTGEPLPLVRDDDDRYCQETVNTSLRDKIRSEMSQNIREHRENEKKFVEEAEKHAAEERAKDEAAMRGEVDQEERYTTLRVKRANLIFTLYQMLSGMKRYKDTLKQTMEILDQMDEEFPEYKNTFMYRYNKAAEEVGLPPDKNHIIRYMTGPVPFDLSAIPDEIEVMPSEVPIIVPIDVNNLDYHAIAGKMVKEGEKNRARSEPSNEPSDVPQEEKESA